MAIDEETRQLLQRTLQPVIGEDAAMALIGELPGQDVATRQDVDQVRQDLVLLEHKVDLVRADLVAAFRGELLAAVSSQARMSVLGLLGALTLLGTLMFTMARFA